MNWLLADCWPSALTVPGSVSSTLMWDGGKGRQEALLLPSPGPTPAQIALLKFSSHRAAAMAKKALVEGRTRDCGGPLGWEQTLYAGHLTSTISIVQQSGLKLLELTVKFETDYLTSRFYIFTGPTSYQ